MPRHFSVCFLCLVVAAPAAAQITRVSISTAGVEGNGASVDPAISGDGRFVVFSSLASNLVADDTNGVEDIFLRDRDTDTDGVFDEAGAVATTRLSVASGGVQATGASIEPVITPDGRYVAFSSVAPNLLAGSNAVSQVYRLDRTTGTLIRVSEHADGAAGTAGSTDPSISDDGNVVAFASLASNLADDPAPAGQFPTTNFVRDVSADRTTRLFVAGERVSLVDYYTRPPSISGDGRRVMFTEFGVVVGHLFRLATSIVDIVSNTATQLSLKEHEDMLMTADGSALVIGGRTLAMDTMVRRVIGTGAEIALPNVYPDVPVAVSDTGRLAVTTNMRLVDFGVGVATPPAFFLTGTQRRFLSSFEVADFSRDDRWLAVASRDATLVPGNGDTNGIDDVFVVDLPGFVDADNDTMDDRWEALFGVSDPTADPDTDGQTNAQEEDAGTHPNGQVRRFLAEGATGTFFHTSIALANPSPALPATAVLTFDRGDGTRVRHAFGIPAGRSAVVDAGAIPGLEGADVSTTVESDVLLGVQRSMTWGAADGPIYGSHSETAGPAPSPTWFLAEGSTVLGFDLFYLLQNPQATTTQATVRYLLPSGTVITRTYSLAPRSRTTVYVNQVAGLDETDVSGDITADAPIVVERAMYRSTPGQTFVLGHDSMGVTAAATSWFLAEGATGTFFDLYVLIANPGSTDATVQAVYGRPDGSTVTQTYTVQAHSRYSVYVDSIPGLEATSVATTLTSTNAVPIVAERAMYWPGGFFDYYEGHSSAGSATAALSWIVAGGEHEGAYAAQTFVLIANTENRVGEASITTLFDRSVAGSGLPAPTTIALPANSRTTVPITAAGSPFGVLVTSTGASPVQLVVESAVYHSALGTTWSAGSNALATPVP
jgi:hypothetical protein